jgi:hypothetical protein
VDQAGGAEGVTGGFGLELAVGNPAELVVDQRKQALHRTGAVVSKLQQEIRDIAIA